VPHLHALHVRLGGLDVSTVYYINLLTYWWLVGGCEASEWRAEA